MSSFQKVIKYCAVAFAILLAVGIITGIARAALSVVSLVSGDLIYRYDRHDLQDTDVVNWSQALVGAIFAII